MANRSKLTVKSVSEALKIHAGVIAYAARALNTDRRHVYTFSGDLVQRMDVEQ